MALNRNFDTPLPIVGGVVDVTGSSDAVPDMELLSRHVALQQDRSIVRGPATLSRKWGAEPALPPSGFQPGPAVATGTETFRVDSPPAVTTFATFTWTQMVELVEDSAA